MIFGAHIPFGVAQVSEVKTIEGFVQIQDVDPSLIVELRYAAENNFTGQKIYPVAVCLARKETALKLAAANAEFQKDGYSIKVWDAYRPPYVQKIFWDLVPDERYVANPGKGGSKHNRGGAVDITLVDKNGNEVDMPTDFDDFSDRAWRHSALMTEQERKNVEYLTAVMEKHGFIPLEHEWWHFDDKDWQDFPLVDVRLEEFLEDSTTIPDALKSLVNTVKQAVIVEPASPQGFQAKLTAWEMADGLWQMVYGPVDAVLGKNGFSPSGEKKEGDGRTPSGIFPLGTTFGYAPAVETGLPYRQVTAEDFWIDDPQSPQYNQWITGTPAAKSFEKLKRDDDLYKYGIVIEYNTNPVIQGAGSAIFLHVWRSPESPTTGCVAVSEENMLRLLKWLDKTKNPVIILEE